MKRKFIIVIITTLICPFWIAGKFLYYLGKFIKAVGYFLTFHPGSAKQELREFFTFKYDFSDL
jgi:hypothetical protein